MSEYRGSKRVREEKKQNTRRRETTAEIPALNVQSRARSISARASLSIHLRNVVSHRRLEPAKEFAAEKPRACFPHENAAIVSEAPGKTPRPRGTNPCSVPSHVSFVVVHANRRKIDDEKSVRHYCLICSRQR